MTRLLEPQHLADLRRSSLTDTTIEEVGFFSETDPDRIAKILGWDRPATDLGPCLVIPFRTLDGTVNGFARVRPDRPRIADGKAVKYEQPRGKSPRAFFTREAVIAANTKRVLLAFCEGEKKAATTSQAGIPCIGLCGVWSWTRNRDEKGTDRQLIEDLAAIDWTERPVPIVFDTDPLRNPNVNHAQAEFLRVLSSLGAAPFPVFLPLGPRGADGMPAKVGADDFIAANGEQAFRELVERARDSKQEVRSIDDYRADLVRSRVESIELPGVYLDTSPPGAGKTFADRPAAEAAKKSLTVLPTHSNCEEVEQSYLEFGLDAKSYPELTRETCPNYDEAVLAIGAGLSASGAVCPDCKFSGDCDYRGTMQDVETASHKLATHKRAQLSFESISQGARFVAVHEDAAALLRPTEEIAFGLERVAEVAKIAGDEATNRVPPDDTARHYFWKIENVAAWLQKSLSDADSTVSLPKPVAAGKPVGADAALFRAMRSLGRFPESAAMRICRALADGDLADVTIRVDRVYQPGGATVVKKSVLGVWQTALPKNAAVWFSDATADAEEIEALAGRPVVNKTPPGALERRHAAVQVPLDVTQGTGAKRILGVLRGVLAAFPEYRRIGVVCHRAHAALVRGSSRKGENLDPASQQRIAKVEYYRGGEARGSNAWLAECDAIVALGTPRVPPTAVKARLIRAGNAQAAGRDGHWERDYWSAITTSGRRLTVCTLAYRDRDWHKAHQALVQAELLQAIGRGRGILETGLPVIAVTTEPLGLPVLDMPVKPVKNAAIRVLETIVQLSAQTPKGVSPSDGSVSLTAQSPNIYIGNSAVKPLLRVIGSNRLAETLNLKERRLRYALGDLEKQGLVARIGKRCGWVPTDTGVALVRSGDAILSMPRPENNPLAAGPAVAPPAAPPSSPPRDGNAPDSALPGDVPLARRVLPGDFVPGRHREQHGATTVLTPSLPPPSSGVTPDTPPVAGPSWRSAATPGREHTTVTQSSFG